MARTSQGTYQGIAPRARLCFFAHSQKNNEGAQRHQGQLAWHNIAGGMNAQGTCPHVPEGHE
eukprot:3238671-Pyramimonas_sp.AAC.1